MADCKESTDETNCPRPPITMKFDAPEESSENSTNEDTEGQSNEENSEAPSPPCNKLAKILCPVLAASKFGNSFGVSEFSDSSKPKSALLRPSALSSITTTSPDLSSKNHGLQAPRFNNPFTKIPDDRVIDDNTGTTHDIDSRNKDNETKSEDYKNEDKTCDETAPKFLPLVTSTEDNENGVNNAVASNSSTPSFVFGQNLKERVTVSSDAESSASSEKDEPKEDITSTNENGSSELSFSNAATVCRSTATRTGLTLTQAAQEMEEANRANKRKYNQVTPLTGEEGETNVLQINCKLFAFEAKSDWQERGRGILRLNDRDDESRLVARVSGTQRLVINTKVWPGMTAALASRKTLRLTAMDAQGDVRIFIVQAAPKEIDQFHSLLMQRIKRAQERQTKETTTLKFDDSTSSSEYPDSSKPKSSLLRPSALSSIATTNPATSSMIHGLQSTRFNNPFTKIPNFDVLEDNGTGIRETGTINKDNEAMLESVKNEVKIGDETARKFLPLVASYDDTENNVNNAVTSNMSTPSFVFGQNLKERVKVSDESESKDNTDKDESKVDVTSTNENGTSELLFSNAATVCRSSAMRSGLTLTQAAQEIEEANRANKRKYNQVTPLTGEEGETNVLQINCKLFAFDKATSGWQERGRGTLRLNDRDEESRLVGRAAGTQRLVLNTKIWPGMTAERAGPKSLRLTAMDIQGDIRIFIIQAAPKEVDQLHSLLLQRLKRAQERQPKKLATDH